MASASAHNFQIHSAYYRLVLIDALVFLGVYNLAAYLYFLAEPDRLGGDLGGLSVRAIIFAVVSISSLMAMGLYQLHLRESASGILVRTAGAFTLVLLAMSLLFYLFPGLYLWRGIFLYTTGLAFIASLASRMVFTRLADVEQLKSRILIYGSGEAANTVLTHMRRRADLQGVAIVGFICAEGEEIVVPEDRLIHLNETLCRFVEKQGIEQIVIAVNDKRSQTPVDELVECRMNGVEIIGLVNFFQQQAGKILVDFITPGC